MGSQEEVNLLRDAFTDPTSIKLIADRAFLQERAHGTPPAPRGIPAANRVGNLTVEWVVDERQHDVLIKWWRAPKITLPVYGYVKTGARPDPRTETAEKLGERIESSEHASGGLTQRISRGSDYYFTFLMMKERHTPLFLSHFFFSRSVDHIDSIVFKARLADRNPHLFDVKYMIEILTEENRLKKMIEGELPESEKRRRRVEEIVQSHVHFAKVSDEMTRRYRAAMRDIDADPTLDEQEKQEERELKTSNYRIILQQLNRAFNE